MELGTPAVFAGTWLAMMAAMMLPGALPAVTRAVAASRRALTAPLFAGSYLGVWALFGLVVYAVYEPPGAAVTGAVTIAAGAYELTPLKRACRRRCRSTVRTGAQFGIYCVGSSIGLMAMLVAVGVMSIAWAVVVGALVTVQKLLPPRLFVDVPVALAIVALGVVLLPL
jgi:predicted metal-binding membrane protein